MGKCLIGDAKPAGPVVDGMVHIGWWCPTCGVVMPWRLASAHRGSSGYDCNTPGAELRPAYIQASDKTEIRQ